MTFDAEKIIDIVVENLREKHIHVHDKRGDENIIVLNLTGKGNRGGEFW